MWKKIHSNRDPRDTLYSEVRKEFGSYFNIAGRAGNNLVSSYPRFFFGSMVVLMLLSMALSFTVFRTPPPKTAVVKARVNPVQDGFSQILVISGHIRETLQLKKVVDSLSARKQLSHADSISLDSALDRLSSIHQKNK